MANSVITVTVTQSWKDSGQIYHVLGTIGIAAGDYPAGGLTVSLVAAAIKAQRTPLLVQVSGQQKGSAQTQYDYSYVPGADASNGKVKIFTGGTEASTTTPSGVVADTIQFHAMFLGMN